MAEVIMHGLPDVTLKGSAAHNVPRSVLSFHMTHICGIYTSAIIQLFLMIHCMWKLLVYTGVQHYIHFARKLILEPKYESHTGRRFNDNWVDSHDESKSLKITFPVEVFDHLLAYTLDAA